MTLRKPVSRNTLRGFSQLEVIMVIVITAILVAIVALFVTKPITGYVEAQRRAELANAADLALRRITREIRAALPYSLRNTGTASGDCLEFIITSAGGKYRDSTVDGSTGGDSLSFTSTADTSFDLLGLSTPTGIKGGDYVVINNIGVSPVDAYQGGNRAQISGAATLTANPITLSTNPFAAQSPVRPSPTQQFHVVPGSIQAVTYRCTGGELRRYSNYGFNATQVCPPVGGSNNLMVANAATCQFNFSSTFNLLYLKLTLTESAHGEAVTLFDQVHIDNLP